MRTLEETATIQDSDQAILQGIKERICDRLPEATVLVYGSVARGARGPDSDFDILVLTGFRLNAEQQEHVRDGVYELELDREVVVSMVFCTRNEWAAPRVRVSPFCREAERDGVVI